MSCLFRYLPDVSYVLVVLRKQNCAEGRLFLLVSSGE